MKITIQQCIFLISNLTKKQNRIFLSLNSYSNIPIKVNGKDVFDKTQAKEMLALYSELEIINRDLATLKTVLNHTNSTNKINDMPISYHLEDLKNKRNLLSFLERSINSNTSSAESGVGIVNYGVLNQNILKENYRKLEKEVNSMSERIDIENSKLTIEVNLEGNY
ncbi:hypothetical protein [Streptobacillus moniliformis]|uniref:Uncharacterized protein n=1 Tax=Streptobacillus moniliformis (strain ATCC 14647 / DSM 12112 / NCTC 10651 / 9901) TaxID=519441 RepID=D1AVW8_STRM9|nr:hypothetical protein [Streptobacillus moniliformis]ACZ01878.1 hypothetical protein Smon_1445 [Streptobacillus moniliformis DSM 12112]AVL43130.1 hypothetical protein CEP89_04495 [Streptobacillus moniliformis]SQA12916.1 Uncharacterised protein [Streptobacillus moniliformis]